MGKFGSGDTKWFVKDRFGMFRVDPARTARGNGGSVQGAVRSDPIEDRQRAAAGGNVRLRHYRDDADSAAVRFTSTRRSKTKIIRSISNASIPIFSTRKRGRKPRVKRE